jgi:hypothetical protein
MVLRVLLTPDLFAAFGWEPQGACVAALAGSGVAFSGGAQLLFSNPAAVAGTGAEVTVVWSPGSYDLPELRRLAVAASLPLGAVRPGLAVERGGCDLYRETTMSLAAGLPVSDRLAAGAVLSLYHLAIPGYGSASTVGIHSGIRFRVVPELFCGVVLRNWNVPRLGRARERLEPEAVLGIAWHVSGRLALAWDVSKQAPFPPSLHAGVRYAPLDRIELRMGAMTEPGAFAAGLAVNGGPVEAEYACRFHPVLGETHVFSVTLKPTGS